jgi:5-formyltetrahydrofolate cyclo-ligase
MEGKAVALPRVEWTSRAMCAHVVSDLDADLEPDPGNPSAGLMQPRATCPEVLLNSLDLLLIPGLGFDLRGSRIGHGAGFYDRFLARHEAAGGRGTVCGVGFEAQVLPDGQFLPREPHDRPLAALVTEARTIRFPGLAPGRPE